jgi:hypothetical protein
MQKSSSILRSTVSFLYNDGRNSGSCFIRLPGHFNYSRSEKTKSQVMRYKKNTQPPNNSYPTSVTTYESGFFSLYNILSSTSNFHKGDYKNYKKHHKSFIYQGLNFLINSPYEIFSQWSKTYRTITNNSIVVYLKPERRIIDKALEKYRPEKYECFDHL